MTWTHNLDAKIAIASTSQLYPASFSLTQNKNTLVLLYKIYLRIYLSYGFLVFKRRKQTDPFLTIPHHVSISSPHLSLPHLQPTTPPLPPGMPISKVSKSQPSFFPYLGHHKHHPNTKLKQKQIWICYKLKGGLSDNHLELPLFQPHKPSQLYQNFETRGGQKSFGNTSLFSHKIQQLFLYLEISKTVPHKLLSVLSIPLSSHWESEENRGREGTEPNSYLFSRPARIFSISPSVLPQLKKRRKPNFKSSS